MGIITAHLKIPKKVFFKGQVEHPNVGGGVQSPLQNRIRDMIFGMQACLYRERKVLDPKIFYPPPFPLYGGKNMSPFEVNKVVYSFPLKVDLET